ncbi:hypothetical protein CRYUN_Cryun01aG0241200 [Craigia yunnanensis]
MLGSSTSGGSISAWKVLIMEKVTVKVMSHSCKMADITDQGVSLVEDHFRRRQPLPSMDAIYFIQPSKEKRCELCKKLGFITDHETTLEELFSEDAEKSRKFEVCLNTMATRIATVFASLKELPFVRYRVVKTQDTSTASTRDLIPSKLAEAAWNCLLKYKTIPNFPRTKTCELLILDRSVDQIKDGSELSMRDLQKIIQALPQYNEIVEKLSLHVEGFITDHETALEELFSEDAEKSRKFEVCLNTMATRIATVFASLKELPFVRYRAVKTQDASTVSIRDLIPSKLAEAIAPVIHEWTDDAMFHDLLGMDGNKYMLEVPNKSGGPLEKKEVLLEDHDPVWLELRHAHIADASERLHDKMTNFKSRGKAAQIQRTRLVASLLILVK